MKKYSKSLLTICVSVLLGLLGANANAQMQAAKKLDIDVSKTTTYIASPSDVWEIVSKLDKVENYANGYVVSSVVTDKQMPADRTIKLKSGAERKEQIEQLNEPYKFYCFNIISPLPKGVEEVTLACSINLDDKDHSKTNVRWWAVVKGNAESKKQLVTEIEQEFDQYAEGLKKLLTK